MTSDPANRARIVAATGKTGVAVSNVGQVIVENLIVSGPGMNLTKAIGVRAVSDGGRFRGLTFRNLDVSGFNEGLQVLSYNKATDGFDDVLIESCALHDNLQGGGSTYGLAATAMTNVVVRCGRFYNNPGDPVVKRPSGDGFVLGGVTNGLIESCVAYNNGGQGTNNAGPVGLWAYDSTKITIQFSEAYGNKALKMDGDGFDLDIGVTDSVIQYCYAHDNYGAGFLLSQAGTSPWRNNIIRYNVSENDASGQKLGAITFYSAAGAQGLQNVQVYGNTVYTSVGPALNLTSESNVSGVRVFNNIFMTAKDQRLVWDWSGNAKAGNILVQGNLYWASGGKVDFQGATSLAAWRAAQGQELLDGMAVGVFADPKLTQPGGGRVIGDPLKLVVWKQAARAQARGSSDLVSRDTQQAQRVELWLDFAQAGSIDTEHRLSRLCAWVLQADRLGVDYGLRLPGVEIKPACGEAHKRRCLEALALC